MTTAQNIQIEHAVAHWLAQGAPTPRPRQTPKHTPKKTGQPESQPVKSGRKRPEGRHFTPAGVKPMRARLRE